MQNLTFTELDKYARVAVAVSGGADSMALAHMLGAYAAKRKKKLHIHAITVDHGLRPESAREAVQVSKWLSKWPHVTHEILRWEGAKPKTGKMEAARAARYGLMAAYCKKHSINILAVAHHADDQAETFFMRVAHGSGLDGLAGMQRMAPQGDTFSIYRPLLAITHADIVAYCKTHKIKWVEDPTNTNKKYTRTRLRQALASEGFDAKRLATTLARLGRAGDALATIAAKAAHETGVGTTATSETYNLAALKTFPFEIFLRVLRVAIENRGRGGYGPRLEKLEEIAVDMASAKVKRKATLGGCIIEADPKRNHLKILREAT